MLSTHSPYLKLQQYLDCFAEATPIHELGRRREEPDADEAAIKWVALAILHGLSERAEAIELTRSAGGDVRAATNGGKLPAPDSGLAPRVFEAVRAVAHLDADQGRMPLVLGIRNDSLDFEVAVNRTPGGEALTIRLPRVGTA